MEHKHKRHKLFSELKGYVPRAALGFIDVELARSRTFGFDKEDYGCVQKTSLLLPCASIIVDKRKKKLHILLDEVNPNWQRLSVHREEVDAHFSVMEEWNIIQEHLKRAPYRMKLNVESTRISGGHSVESTSKKSGN